MRITVVATWFPTRKTEGAGAFVARDVQALATRHDVQVVHLVAPRDDDGVRRWRHRGAPVIRVLMDPRRPLQILRARIVLQALLDGSEVVHTMAASALEPFALRRPPMPWVHTEHWSGIPAIAGGEVGSAVRGAARLLLRKPDAVVAVGPHLGAAVGQLRGSPPEIIGNIVEVPEGPIARRTPDDALRLVAVGNLIDHKDPVLAVETVRELVNRGIDATLTWVGDGPLRAEVRRHADRTGLGRRIRLVGQVPRAEVLRHLADADVFVLPTRSETFSLAAAEALAVGRPVVIGAVGGHREFVAPPAGQMVVDRTSTAYADAIERVHERTRAMAPAEIAGDITQRYSEQAFLDAYERVYSRVRQGERL